MLLTIENDREVSKKYCITPHSPRKRKDGIVTRPFLVGHSKPFLCAIYLLLLLVFAPCEGGHDVGSHVYSSLLLKIQGLALVTNQYQVLRVTTVLSALKK